VSRIARDAKAAATRVAKKLRRTFEPAPPSPIFVFTHHKTGTVLFRNLFHEVARTFGWSWSEHFRWCDDPPGTDVTFFGTSLAGPRVMAQEFRGVHVVRDPRNVLLSGYGYHRRCRERWCINTDFDPSTPIRFPRVPYSQEHRPEEWKRAYLDGLAGRSYQQHLLDCDVDRGLIFEMEHYAAWTTEQMLAWNYHDPRVLEVKLEDVTSGFDEAMHDIFGHLLLTSSQVARAQRIAQRHDLSRMPREDVAALSHVSAHQTDWREQLQPLHEAEYRARFGEAHSKLGYRD
jgi:hypothetical protein